MDRSLQDIISEMGGEVFEIPNGEIPAFLKLLMEAPECTDPECGWPKTPEQLAALHIGTFLFGGNTEEDQANRDSFHFGIAIHHETTDALIEWTGRHLCELTDEPYDAEAVENDKRLLREQLWRSTCLSACDGRVGSLRHYPR